MFRFGEIFNCKNGYAREEEGPWGDCKHCYWGFG